MKAVVFDAILYKVTITIIAIRLTAPESKDRQRLLDNLKVGGKVLLITKSNQESTWVSNHEPQKWLDDLPPGETSGMINLFCAGMRGLHSRLENDFDSIRDGDVINLTDYAAGRS
jgi:hypothetical protein